MPSPPPPPPPAGVTARKDPHLHFAHGGRGDFRGEHDKIFNFLSARNISMNARVEAADFHWAKRAVHGSRFASVYWTIRTTGNRILQVEYHATNTTAVVHNLNETSPASRDATLVKKSQAQIESNDFYGATYVLDNVIVKLISRECSVTVDGKWAMSAKASPFPFASLNRVDESSMESATITKSLLDLSAIPLYDVEMDVVAPHGILGQSFDGDDVGIDGKIDSKMKENEETTTIAQAEGAIEGVHTDYMIKGSRDPFSTSFKYSRFDSVAAKPRDVSTLTGNRHKHGANDLKKRASSSSVWMKEYFSEEHL